MLPEIDRILEGLEHIAAPQSAAFRATESQLSPWRATCTTNARQAAVEEAGLHPKRVKRDIDNETVVVKKEQPVGSKDTEAWGGAHVLSTATPMLEVVPRFPWWYSAGLLASRVIRT